MNKERLESSWMITVGGVLLSFFLTVAYDLLKKVPVLTTIRQVFKTIWTIGMGILNFNLKLWWLLVGIASIIFLIYIFPFFQKEPPKPEYIDDVFNNWRWTWNWIYNRYQGGWIVSNLNAHCPECDTMLIYYDNNQGFECPRCGFNEWHSSREPFKIDRLIRDNLRREAAGI